MIATITVFNAAGGATPDLVSARVLSTADDAASGSGAYVELRLNGAWPGATVDPGKVSATVTSPGYQDAVATTFTRSIPCVSQRLWHERAGVSGGRYNFYEESIDGDTVIQIVLGRPVYQGDTGLVLSFDAGWVIDDNAQSGMAGSAEVDNGSDEPYPRMQAHWATEDHRPLLLRDTTFEVCAHSAHAFDIEQAGKHRPADAVVFEISNGVTTVTASATEITNSTYADEVDAYLADVFGARFGPNGNEALTVTRPSEGLAQPVFAVTVDLAAAGFAEGDILTVNATAYPFVGNAGNTITSDGLTDALFSEQTHKIMGTNRLFVTFDGGSSSATPSSEILEAAAAPGSSSENALEQANAANGNSFDGVVLMLPQGRPDIGARSFRIGDSSKPNAIDTTVVGIEIIPLPGEDGAGITIQKPSASYSVPGRLRAYGVNIDMSTRANFGESIKVSRNNLSSYATSAALFPLAGTANGDSGTGQIANADKTFVMGGNFSALGTGSFASKTWWRGASIGDGLSGNNFSPLVLGCNLGSVRLINDLTTSNISCAGKMRWACATTTEAEPLSHNMANTRGFSLLLCAAYGSRDSLGSWAYKFNADANENALQYMHVAMTTLLGGRANVLYDHNQTPSGPKWANEIYGSVLSSENMKRPWFGSRNVDSSDYPDFYRWGAADPYWYGNGKGWNVVCTNYSGTWSPDSYIGPNRVEGYRYGLVDDSNTVAPGMPQPYADPFNGDWTVLSDAAWLAQPSTQELLADPDRDEEDRDGYATNIISALVPAERVPVPFDLYGGAYPATGMVEAGPVQYRPAIHAPAHLIIGEGASITFEVSLDSPPRNGALTLTVGRTSGDASLSVTGGASLTFDATNHETPQTVTLAASDDGDAVSGEATVTISGTGVLPFEVRVTVLDREQPPIVEADAYDSIPGETISVAAPGILENDTAARGETLSAVLIDDVDHGGLTLNADGSFSYIPDAGFAGVDTFTYVAVEGAYQSVETSVTLKLAYEGLEIRRFGLTQTHAPEVYDGSQFIEGNAEVIGDGKTLYIEGNGFWMLDLGQIDVTPSTVLAFDFSSTAEGEIHAVGFDDNEASNREYTIQFYGTQTNYSDHYLDDYDDTAPDVKRYTVSVGQFYTGAFRYLFLVHDHDVSLPDAKSVYSNIRIYDSNTAPYEGWTAAMGLTAGVDDGFSDATQPGGKPNYFYFALDGDPHSGASVQQKVHTEHVQPGDGSSSFQFTAPVRAGASFSGNPPTSAPIDGLIYTVLAETDLQAPWGDLPLIEVAPAVNGLPALSDIDGPLGSDWEYRTFRIDGSVPSACFFLLQVDSSLMTHLLIQR